MQSKSVSSPYLSILSILINARQKWRPYQSCPGSLPPELILNILEENYYTTSHDPVPDRHILLQLSLVSRSWSRLAQRLLFRRVTLQEKTLPTFLSAIQPNTSRARYLGESVKTLEVTLAQSHEGQRSFAKILLACPQLYDLDLRFESGVCGLRDDVISLLEQQPPSITTLSLFNQRDSAVLWQLVRLIRPTLQFLFVDVSLGPLEASSRPPSETSLPNLIEFAWLDYASYGFTEEILRASKGTLEVLSVYALLPDHKFIQLLQSHGPRLRALRLQACRAELHEVIKETCGRLEEYISYEMPPAEVLSALPATIEHIGWYQTAHVSKEALEYLENGSRLRVFTYVWGDSDPRIEEIRAICTKRGIELRHAVRVR